MLHRAVLLILWVSITICLAAKDYYQVLGVERDSSTAQVKRAFKKLALKHHPDKSDDPKASEKFMEITTAYETLFNEDKRKAYDRLGHEAYVRSKKQGGTPEEEAAFTNFFRQSTASSPDHEGYFESFDKFFSGGFGPGQGGMYFRTDGAPMFQVDPEVPISNYFSSKSFEFEFIKPNFHDGGTKQQEHKQRFPGTGFYRVVDEAPMFGAMNKLSEMLFAEMRQDLITEQYRAHFKGGHRKVHTVHKRVVSTAQSAHVQQSKSSSWHEKRVNKPILEKSRTRSAHSRTCSSIPQDSNSFNSFATPPKDPLSACRTNHCRMAKSSYADIEAPSTVRAKNALPEISPNETYINFDLSKYLTKLAMVCRSAMNSVWEAIFCLCRESLSWLYSVVSMCTVETYYFIFAVFILILLRH